MILQIAREGDPVQRMLFVVRGHLQSSQVLRDGLKSCCMLGPGNFSGDELLSWCLRRPFIERLPLSTSTLVTLETTEAFGLEAEDVKYVTQHFRYKLPLHLHIMNGVLIFLDSVFLFCGG